MLLQSGQTERLRFKFLLQIGQNACLLVLSRSDVERFDEQSRSAVGITPVMQLAPQIAPIVIGE